MEGRDDMSAVLRAVEADVIPTHGYGISESVLARIRSAYEKRGIIILTDPDHAGKSIRNRLGREFPEAHHACLSKADAEKEGDIGIENAAPEAIIRALEAAGRTVFAEPLPESERPSGKDLYELGLSSSEGAAVLREKVGGLLGIGGGNTRAFLKKLILAGISCKELEIAVREALELAKEADRGDENGK